MGRDWQQALEDVRAYIAEAREINHESGPDTATTLLNAALSALTDVVERLARETLPATVEID